MEDSNSNDKMDCSEAPAPKEEADDDVKVRGKYKPLDKQTELELSRQRAYEKLQKLLRCSQKYSTFLVQELARFKNPNDRPNADLPVYAPYMPNEDDYKHSNKRQKIASDRFVDVGHLNNRQPKLLNGEMRSYQLDGFEWLKLMYENGVSCILADEMGLGKTIQAISFLAHLIERGIAGPFLIVAPLSTLPNWVNEFKRFSPEIPILLYHGNMETRDSLIKSISKLHYFGSWKSYPVVITSYELPMNDKRILGSYKWRTLVIDEGHRIKNINCQLRKALSSYRVGHKILLTGTPLQNNLTELWSLLNFIIPEIFNDLDVFESWFDVSSLSEKGGDEAIIAQEQERHIVESMHEILSPFLLRRTKAEVEINLPPKKEILVYAPKSEKQETFYQQTVDKTIAKYVGKPAKSKENENIVEVIDLMKNGRPKRRCNQTNKEKPKQEFEVSLSLQNLMMHFRKICNHPYLIENPLDSVTGYHEISEKIVEECGKLQVLDCLLKGLKARGHKVLIFSFMVRMLNIIEDYCQLRNWTFCRLDGPMKLSDRCDQIAEFNSNPDIFLFLISTTAGGLGINLTAADTVILYDTNWNPQVDLQAQDRCHRIGQSKPVVVYRLITANSIEERMIARANAKRKLEKMIMKNGMFSGGVKSVRISGLTIEELKELLMADDHSETVKSRSGGAIFTEEELNSLLDRTDMTRVKNEVVGVYKVLSVGDLEVEY